MKLNQKLGIGALVLGVLGCNSCNNDVKNISTDVIQPRAYERYVVNTNLSECQQAEVLMDSKVYEIFCGDNSFISSVGFGDKLSWGNNVYYDVNQDGFLDGITVDGVFYYKDMIHQEQNGWYNRKLVDLGNDAVKKVWQERWHLCDQE